MVFGLVVPAAILTAFGLPEKFTVYLILVGMIPFQYATYCILRSRRAVLTTRYKVAEVPAISAGLEIFLSDSIAENWAERVEIQRTQSEELQRRLIAVLAPASTISQGARLLQHPLFAPSTLGAPNAAISSTSR
jgi:hypothetical protein